MYYAVPRTCCKNNIDEEIKKADNLTWRAPLTKAQQIKVTLLNRNAPRSSSDRAVNVTFRVCDIWNGRKRQTDIKVVLKNDDNEDHIYFARSRMKPQYTHSK